MRQQGVNQTGSDALSRMSIYDVMVLDALGCVAAFGLAILLGVIGLGKGLGGVVLCGTTAAGLLAYRHLTAGTSAADRQADDSAPSPQKLIIDLEAVLLFKPDDVSLSGMIIALELACELGGRPPETHEEMLERLNYDRLVHAYGADICIERDDVLNAHRYYLTVHWVEGLKWSTRPRGLIAFMTAGRVASKPERRDGVVTFVLAVNAAHTLGNVTVMVPTCYDVKVSGQAAQAALEDLDVGVEVTIRGSVGLGMQQLKIGGEPVFYDADQERPVIMRSPQLCAAEVTVCQ